MSVNVLDDAVNLIKAQFQEGQKIITIDGWTGAGKTTISKQIKENENLTKISLDGYFEKNTGLYLEVFDYDKLNNNIKEIHECGKSILIEGICIDQIMESCGFEPNYKVYIRQLDPNGEWYYDKYLDENKSLEDIFKEEDDEAPIVFDEENNSVKIDASIEIDELSQTRKGVFYDLVRYHRKYYPYVNCDLLYEIPYAQINNE